MNLRVVAGMLILGGEPRLFVSCPSVCGDRAVVPDENKTSLSEMHVVIVLQR